MAIIKFDIVRKKNHAPILEALRQEFPKMSSAFTQLGFNRILNAYAIGFVVVKHDTIFPIGEVLNEAHEDRSTP